MAIPQKPAACGALLFGDMLVLWFMDDVPSLWLDVSFEVKWGVC
jgi:hypothetical protein